MFLGAPGSALMPVSFLPFWVGTQGHSNGYICNDVIMPENIKQCPACELPRGIFAVPCWRHCAWLGGPLV